VISENVIDNGVLPLAVIAQTIQLPRSQSIPKDGTDGNI
jgi:hypothetical protein